MSNQELKFETFEWMTFDCYGTLIDWEDGINAALVPILAAHGLAPSRDEILELYGQLEAELEAETHAYISYRDVLAQVVEGFGEKLGFRPTSREIQSLPDFLPSWKPFPDTVRSLQDLKRRYKLGIISNTDDDLFAASAKCLKVAFDEVVTAQQARSYKPALNNFRLAMQRIAVPKAKILHVAQSVFHDVVPARQLGLASVWVNRRARKRGAGATKPAVETSDLEVADLATLARMVG